MQTNDNNQRQGVDVRVALSSKAKLQSWGNRRQAEPRSTAFDSAAAGVRSVVKGALRSLARVAFKAVKPFARPIAFRLRAYLIGPLQAETQQFHLKLAQDLKSHSRAQLEALDRRLTVRTTDMLQELLAFQESRAPASPDPSPLVLGKLDRIEQLADANLPSPAVLSRLDRIEQMAVAAAHRVAVPCGPEALLLRTVVGPVLCPASDFALVSFLMETGELERGTRLLIQHLLKPGDTFVDAGANIGLHTLAAAQAMGGQGRIVAFEPFPATHDLLRKSAWMNGFPGIIETHEAAVSNRAGKQLLFLGATSGHHSLYPLPSSAPFPTTPVEVPLVRIDDVIGQGPKVDLMKIDVEGAELETIEGAAQVIAGNPEIALIVEFGISHLRRSNHTPAEWLGHFEQMGLAYNAIDPDSGALRDISTPELESSFSVNLFFARTGSATWRRAKEMA